VLGLGEFEHLRNVLHRMIIHGPVIE
jgi:hypothetical protein